MIKTIIHKLLERRHFWRLVDFGELAELYSSMLIRGVAVGMLQPFIQLYLLQNGMSLIQVIWAMIGYFSVRLIMTIPSAYVIGRIGPKHATLLSNIIYVPGTISLSLYPVFHIWALLVFILLQGTAISIFNISYTVDFSKVKRIEHAGKEIGYMSIIQTVAAAASPLAGGIIAALFGAQWTIYFAGGLSLIAALPLFFTNEPILTHQRIHFRGLNWKAIRRNIFAQTAVGVDAQTSNTVWPVFIILIIIGSASAAAYAQIGALASLIVIGSLISSRFYGAIIDRHKGGVLLRFSTVFNSTLHLIRGFVTTVGAAAGVNIVNQLFTSGYNMPFLKGMFDTADSLPGYRIAYLGLMEMALCTGMLLVFIIALVCVWLLGTLGGLRLTFILAGVLTVGIMMHGFRVLKQE